MSGEPSQKSDIAEKRRALLMALLQEQEAAGRGAKTIPRRTETGSVPLAFAQERLWFLDQYYPQNSLYNIPAVYPFLGPLNPNAFRASLNEIVRRHESLRTTFINQNGSPLQSVAPALTLDVPLIDLSDRPEEMRQPAASRFISEEGAKPFDLSRGPLLRATLIRLHEQYHLLLLVMHHIVSDAWSMSILLNELQTIYAALSQGRPPILPELPIQYPDFAIWQREWMRGEGMQEQLAYWKRQLDGVDSDTLLLPTDNPRPQSVTFKGGVVSFLFTPKVSAQVRALTQAESITPYMTLLAGFQSLLQRYTRQPAIVVGMPTANRNRTELEGLIGFFVNTLVLRTRLSADLSFRQVLSRVREVVLGAHANQDVPFEKLVEELQPARSLNTNPLFQVMFDFHNRPPVGETSRPAAEPASAEPPIGGDAEIISTESGGTAKFDLTLSMMDAGDRFGGSVEYNADLFEEETIKRLVGHYQTLLEAATADPERPLGSLPLMPTAERHQVLVGWNATRQEFPSESCVHEQFEAQVVRTPEALAVVSGAEQLTYRELNERANRLAHQLRRRGIGPETIVGLCFDGSPEMLVAIFAVLKAGGAYLPLDPAYPAERLSYMLADARAGLLLTQPHLAERVAALGAPEVLLVLEGADQFAGEEGANLPATTTSRNACYVIYTSGSTGRPKGIVIEHRSVLNLVRALEAIYNAGEGRRTLQFSSFSFDQSVREIFETLLGGATLYVAPRSRLMPGEPLLSLLREWKIADVTLVPSIQAHLPYAELPALKVLTSGGEACTQHIVDKWGQGRRYFNAYGPSEITFASSVTECLHGADKPTIGRPLPNVRYYVVDERMQPLPVGIPGELLVGGVGLARGYLGRSALTAERFSPDPFSEEAGARLYRTGDLVRQLPDGRIDYIGRLDQQVKVRGFRIELGEIEAVLTSHAGVAAAAAIICHGEAAGEGQLAAYVVAHGGAVTVEELRHFLSLKLPEYMVPSVFVFLEQMPLAPSGKVDYKALPAPEAVRRQQEQVAPRTALEQVLANIWAEVLGQEQLGVHDNFFELGGHSLLVTQIISRVRDTLHTEIPVHRIFESPTVDQLASALTEDPEKGKKIEAMAELLVRLNALESDEIERLLQQVSAGKLRGAESSAGAPTHGRAEIIRALRPEETVSTVEQIPRRNRQRHAPLSFAQERLWILDQLQPGNTAYNVFRPLPLAGPLDLGALKRAFEQVVERHETLRTTFRVEGGRPVQVIKPRLDFDLAVEDLQGLSPEEKQARSSARIQALVMQPFDLTRGPLFRLLLLRFGPAESILALSIHHIISDEWSIGILTRELGQLYEAALNGRPAALPELPIQCADFALWQRELMQGELLEEHLSFWKKMLADAPAVLDLPTDHPRPTAQSFRGNMEMFGFAPELSSTLEKLNRQENATMFMTILAAYMALLHRYTGQRKVVVGAPITSRSRAELEHLIGFFTNTIVLPAEVRGEMTFRQLLRQVREVTLQAYAHQDLPFERLVEELNPERNPGINPLFQVMFVLQKATGIFAGAGHDAQRPPAAPAGQSGTAKFDLTLYMEETPQGLVGGMEYATDIFETATIRQMLKHFESLLESIAADPDQPVSRLRLLDADETRLLLSEWGASPVPAMSGGGVQALVAAQAGLTPESKAVVAEGRSLTYRELNERANRLAHLLMRKGVGPETFVGVHMERGPELLVGILAILKAGGAYLPLDPSFPRERLSFMIQHADAPLLLTEPHLAARLPASGATVIQVSAATEWLSDENPQNPAARTLPDNAAYVIYTSGSTGQPKGVVLTQRLLEGLVSWQINRPGFARSLRVLQFSSPSFDVSLQEIFSTWCSGGTLVCVDEERRRDFIQLARFLAEQEIERLFLPYVALQQLAEVTAGEELPAPLRLREAVPAGEQLKITPAIRSFFARLDGCQVYNQYGPSETHVTCDYQLGRSSQEWDLLPPIGVPVVGARYYVLDHQGNLVPAGVTGELYIGGDSLGRGYVRRPDLTAERFLPDPFAGVPGARMYRTGDLVKYRADGNLEFIGRCDHQVKIRGFRVELGEVEAALLRHPLVSEAIVVANRQQDGLAQLVGYVVPTAGEAPKPEQVRDFVREFLPDYMVPSQLMLLDALPLTATGKLDRRHLPEPERTRPELKEEFVAPRSPLEEQIAEIWADVLAIQNPGVHDNFFELGGHSLLATQLISRLRSRFSIEFPVRALFEKPTIAGLSFAVVQAQASSANDDDLASLIDNLEQLSEEETKTLLAGGAAGGGER